ncbi:MAG: DUF4331 family protein [Phycisphaerae bacterium]
MNTPTRSVSAIGLSVCAASAGIARAASHSDAPRIKQDRQANITDVYAFVGQKYDDAGQKMLNVMVQVRPFSEPGDGPHYDRFADDARCSIHLANPTTGQTLRRYDFLFSPVDAGLKNPGTILSYGLGTQAGLIQTIGDARQNFTQTYTVTRVMGKGLKKGGGDDDSHDDSARDASGPGELQPTRVYRRRYDGRRVERFSERPAVRR